MLRPLALLLIVALPSFAEDAPDWSKFTNHSKIQGVVVSADLDKIVLSIPALEKKPNNGNNNNNRNRGKGRPNVRIGSEEVTIHYAPSGSVRWAKPPHGLDGKPFSGDDLSKLRKPLGVPGYFAEKTELRPGHVVELHLVRPSEISASKATPKDLVIKYAMIEGETAAPKGKDDKKGK